MQADESPAPLYIILKHSSLFVAEIGGVSLVNNDDIGVRKIGARGRVESAIDNGTVLRKNLAPVGEELRIVVLPGVMRFEAGPDVDVRARCVLSPGYRSLNLRRFLRLNVWAGE